MFKQGVKMKAQRVVPFKGFQPSENLKKLKMMTEHLAPNLSETVFSDAGRVVEFKMEKGIAVSFGLMHEPQVALARTTMSAGSKFPEHSHDEREVILVYQGCLSIFIAGKETILHPGDSIVICPGVAHYASTEVDTKMIAAAVPASPGFPQAD